MTVKKTLLELKGAGLRIKRKDILNNIDFSISDKDYIGIYGLNGSGKSLLSELIAGLIRPDTGTRHINSGLRSSVVSSAERKRMLDEDRHNDDTEFMEGRLDPGRSVRDILRLSADDEVTPVEIKFYADLFGIDPILERGIRFLSTGEFRKMMLAAALLAKPDIIVLDDPFTGLDAETRERLAELIYEIRIKVKALLIVSGRFEDISGTQRHLLLDKGSLVEYENQQDIRKKLLNKLPKIEQSNDVPKQNNNNAIELIRFTDVSMSYYDERILSSINWTVNSGEHWQISGVNGSGKSSLLSLFNGDSPKAYGQQIFLFGKKRGSGETVWEIKQKIGYVSGSLQKEHRINQNVLTVVVSGFFDSIGLYDKPSPVQVQKARGWCSEFGIDDLLEKPFNSLSEGLKRAVLIIRAIVKQPEVLILDEPCQGLDDYNSDFVLSVVRRVISRDHSTLLYVSHDPLYRMKEITNFLELKPHESGGFTAVISEIKE